MKQRKLKFRAFDDGKMLAMPFDTNFGISRFFRMLRDDAIVMQFTGIKDITDKDIYEGDILKVGENLICEIVFVEKNVEDYGDEIHSAFHAKVYRHNKTIPLDSYLKNNCVLIGNVYENSNLVGDVG
jgi:uncharacterized phage protein (TIGR01671 family)